MIGGKPSLAFSWATLGFLLGALFVILLPPPHREKSEEEAPPPSVVQPAPKPLAPMRLSIIENVFEAWSQYAEWTDDSTEVALFDSDTKEYSDCYQVVRAANGIYFFRTIPRLDRAIKSHGIPDNSPLQFTESEEQRAQWLHEVEQENMKAFRKTMGLPETTPGQK
jgi:hypothetical protein